MKVFACSIYLLDPLFYAREGLSAAYTPHYLHATAINFAVTAVISPEVTGLDPQHQSYVIGEHNGGRNTPRYKNSLASDKFYFTPARLTTPLKYLPEWTKGENDGFVAQTKRGEVLKAEILNYLPPEAEFKGFLISKTDVVFPSLIRLGSFRGKARLHLEELEIVGVFEKEQTASHPVDPLITKVFRGVMVNMFPYPIVDNATIARGVVAKSQEEQMLRVIALPDEWQLPVLKMVRNGGRTIIV
ncbi:type I-D CRISPR-associated protein Cas5/Csc1 [candidate division WOR-3 bacterium]|nr:type I-D CRISPR-associated protein Cas5/Csc1 [candidate division WOR-3 bacterium]